MADTSVDSDCEPGETCLTRLESVGLAMVAEAGFISILSLLILFCLIIRNIIRYRRYAPGKWSLIQGPADAYVLSLFIGDLLQAVGAFMDVRWVHRGTIEAGSFCTAQGAIQQLGETGVAMATTVIALHTFVVVWLRRGAKNIKVACAIIAVTWLFVILFVVIAASTIDDYYNPTPLWCWIGKQHNGLRLAGEYIWLWIALFVSVIAYTSLFLWSKGYIAFDEDKWWKISIPWMRNQKKAGNTKRVQPDAPSLALLAYPIAYSIVILPVSVARWAAFQGHNVPDGVTFFSVFLHDMFGFVNVVLLLATKPDLLLFQDPRKSVRRRYNEKRQGRAPGASTSRSPASERFGYDAEEQKPNNSDINIEMEEHPVRIGAPSPSCLSAAGTENSEDYLGAGPKHGPGRV